ncbi:MAG: ABC transporter substrate binding protein [Chloroflexi bacterium]|nr:MAG: ABC transporter substrate binding protein [Chloroflexota bacterium]MBA4374796.1 ABC transporter substrate-binding protein [Anaerolinea sp.]
MIKSQFAIFSKLLILGLILSACSVQNPATEGARVVASTTLVGDVVKQIGRDRISLTVLLPIGADPHTFEPRPQDAAALSDARIIFLNGLELEHSLEPIIETNAKGIIVKVSDGIDALPFNETPAKNNISTSDGTHQQAVGDPHTWMDPNLVIIWVQNITTSLSKADPANSAFYEANAKSYLIELSDLDLWIRSEVAGIPTEKRKLVTDHESLGYFAHRYGFELVGLVVASLSSNASPSAQELAILEDTIRQQGVSAIFVDTTVNPALAQQVAQDTGVKLVPIYSGSLGDANSGVTSYIQFMKANVKAIVEGLK